MRTKRSIINLAVSLGSQGLNIILQFVGRFIFVRHFTEEYLGVNGLFTELLNIFSLAELGIGVSMMYGLYELIAKKQEEDIARLMNLYRRMYMLVGITVAVVGSALIPFLDYFIGDTDIPHIRMIYIMYLANSVISYFFSYKQTLIRADQKEYIVSGVTQIVKCIQLVVQIAAIIVTDNFYLYLGIQIGGQILTNIVLSMIADRKYPYIRTRRYGFPEKETRQDLYRHIRAMAVHRFATVFVFNTDNLLISMFTGLATMGIYSNYKMIVNNLKVVANFIYNALTASVGDLTVTEKPEKILSVYHSLNFGLYLLLGWMSVCLLVLFNPFIELFFGEKYLLPFSTVVIIVADFFIFEMRQMTVCFHNAMGLFWYDRHKPIAEVVINLGLSLLLVREYGISGVLLGTIISSLATNFWVEPLVFFKYGIKTEWKKNLAEYFRRYLVFTAFTVLSAVVCVWAGSLFEGKTVIGLAGKAFAVCVLYSVLAFLVFGRTTEWKFFIGKAIELISHRRKGDVLK